MMQRRYGVPLTDQERMQRHYEQYGTLVLPPRGAGLTRTAMRAGLEQAVVSRAAYLSRIKRAIDYERMLKEIPVEGPPRKTWLCLDAPDQGLLLCGWLQESGGSVYLVLIVLKFLPYAEYENPPATVERIVFSEAHSDTELEEIPEEVANDSLNALPYVFPWMTVGIAAGAVVVAGLAVRSMKR